MGEVGQVVHDRSGRGVSLICRVVHLQTGSGPVGQYVIDPAPSLQFHLGHPELRRELRTAEADPHQEW